jgi:cobalt-zinc-cadmium efflux system outer membrane protein
MRRIILWGSLLLLCPPLAAQEAAPAQDSIIITEREFLSPLIDDPRVRGSLAGDVGAARAALLGARTLEDPELSFEREEPGEAQTTVAVGWQPPWPPRRRLAVDAAEAGVTSAEARLALDLAELRAAWRESFAGWALAAGRAAELTAHRARLDELARRARHRAEAGETSGLEARRFALEAAEAAADLAHAEAARLEARAAALAWRPDLPPDAVPALPALPPAPAAAGAAPLRLAAAEAELAEARLERELAERIVRPPRLSAGWQSQEVPGADADGPVIGVAWPLPLFDRNRAARAAAAARVDSLGARVELLRHRLDAELAGAAARYEHLRGAAEEAAAVAADTAPAETAALAAFTAGELDVTALVDVLAAAHRARLGALELSGEALAAHRQVERLTATPAPARSPAAEPIPSPGPEPPSRGESR